MTPIVIYYQLYNVTMRTDCRHNCTYVKFTFWVQNFRLKYWKTFKFALVEAYWVRDFDEFAFTPNC